MVHVKITHLRRTSQIIFFALFVFLLLHTQFEGLIKNIGGDTTLPYPVKLFFEIDPLIALSNALSSHALYRGLLWSLVILIPTIFVGRFFCGWVCPLGSLHHLISQIRSERKRGKQLIDSNRYKPWQTTKYYLLIFVLIAAILGTGIVGWLDPLSVLGRSLGLSLFPAINYGLNALFGQLEHSQAGGLRAVGTGLHFILGALLSFKQAYFRQAILLGCIFIFLLVLNLRITRFWCRALCPLGALLAIVSRWSILGLVKTPEHCRDCNRCLLACQGGDDPIFGVPWRRSECHFCMNCIESCPEKGLAFKFCPAQISQPVNLQKRKLLASVGAGLAIVPLLRSTSGFAVEQHERLLRPPGALEEEYFLSRCIRCGECMKVCPSNALHPALSEAGLEGIWTPVLVPRIGYCATSCVLCSQICPTGAIWEITSKEKGWTTEIARDSKSIRLGTAFYDRGRCLPWAMGTECIVCEEWCPTSPKAIFLRPAEVTDREGNIKRVKQPYLDPNLCVGCGACEYACPVQDRPAVYVTNVGESRSRTNQILLNRQRR